MPYEAWQPGMIITEERLAAISPTWTDWVPVWSTTTGAAMPSFGDTAIVARYAVSATTVYWRLELTFGASTNFGSGAGTSDNWQFSLPVQAQSAIAQAGSGEIVDNTSAIGSRLRVRCRLVSTTNMVLETSSGRVDAAALTSPNWGVVDSVSPWTWAAGDFVRLSGTYEAAA